MLELYLEVFIYISFQLFRYQSEFVSVCNVCMYVTIRKDKDVLCHVTTLT